MCWYHYFLMSQVLHDCIRIWLKNVFVILYYCLDIWFMEFRHEGLFIFKKLGFLSPWIVKHKKVMEISIRFLCLVWSVVSYDSLNWPLALHNFIFLRSIDVSSPAVSTCNCEMISSVRTSGRASIVSVISLLQPL